jgi:transcriptional regulator, propionate catabolism operon regulatory protein
MPPANTRKARLCFLSHAPLSRLAMEVAAEFAAVAEIEFVDRTFDDAVAQARERERAKAVDAFVSAGSNAALLKGALAAPVATIKVTGYDILVALRRARQRAARAAIVTFGDTIAELDAARGLLDIEIAQRAYRTLDEARRAFEALVAQGHTVFVGSSIVAELAEQAGLHGILAYSPASVRQGFQDAVELARAAQRDAARYDQLDGVLHNLQEAVLAVDAQGVVIALNTPMERVLGQLRQALLGRRLDEVHPELSLTATLASGVEERQRVTQIGRREWLVNRTLMRERGEVAGAVVTLYDAATIQEADTALRTQRRGRQPPQARWRFDQLQGASPAFERARAAAQRFAATGQTVLITGESGTGKELFAQAIHNAGARRGRPFLAINCAAVPEALLESELFGHEEGAFTGARKGGKVGLLEAAHTGTLFLDEIGDMPVLLQTRLLRVLQEREVVRVGGVAPVPVDVRVIAATHRPLDELVAAGRFRADLYYRLNILRLRLPPLRDRGDDVEALTRGFVARSLRAAGSRIDAEELLAPLRPRLLAHAWPGNVRELENVCERIAVVFAQRGRISAAGYEELAFDCPELFAAGGPGAADVGPQQIDAVLAACGGNRVEAARRLGISRSTLWRRMKAAAPAV